MGTLIQEIRLAFRSLRRRPGLTAAVIVTVAVAAGANTAVFTLLYGLLLRSFPHVSAPEGLVALSMRQPTLGIDGGELSITDARDLAEQCTVCAGVATFDDANVILQAGNESERLVGEIVSADLFTVLGVEAEVGRTFLPAEGEPGGGGVVILSHGLWERRFGSDPEITGRSVTVNGRPATVVGVMPRGFRFPEESDLWLPLVPDPVEERSSRYLDGTVARLQPGVGAAAAQAEVDAIGRRLADLYPETNRGWSFAVRPFREVLVHGETRRAVILMQGAVVLVLLIACANVANLLLAREVGRRREVAIRLAVGAGRGPVVRQLLVESLMLAVAGGAGGLILARWGLDFVLASNPEEIPYWQDFSMSGEILLATLVLSLAAGLLFGLLPALRVSRSDLTMALKEGGGPGAAGHQRLQRLLVAGEVALSVVLLFAAGLLMRSSTAVLSADPGFDTDRVLVLRTFLAGERYDAPRARGRFLEEAVERLEAIPGVAAATFTGSVPADDGATTTALVVEGRTEARPGEELLVTYVGSTAGFFRALDVPLLAGRTLTAAESVNEESQVAVINQALARRLAPEPEEVVGRRIRLGEAGDYVWLTVVGVAGDLQYEEFGEETLQSRLQVHVPYYLAAWRSIALMVRTQGDPAALAPAVREEVRRLDPTLAVWDLRTMEEVRRYTTWGQRILGQVFGSFAFIALLLGAVGVYGVMAYTVSLRLHEIGIRLALGADRGRVVRLIVGGGVALAGTGLVLGLAAALATGRLLEGLLFAVEPGDLRTLGAVGATLLAVALAASYLPARRAARVEPSQALRRE